MFRHAKRNSRYRFLHTSFGARVSACEFRQPDFEVRAPKRELEGEDSSATGSQSGIADRLSRMPRSFSLHSDGLVQSRVPFHFARLLPSRAITCQTIPRRKVFPAPQNCPPRSEPFSRRNRNESWLDSKAILGGGGNFSAPIGMRTEPTRAWNLNSDSRCEYFEMSRQLLAPRAQCCSESICAISSWVRGARGESHKNATLRQRRTALEAPKTSKEDSQRAERR